MIPSRLGDLVLTVVNDRVAPPVEAHRHIEVHSWLVIRARSGSLHLVTLRDVSAGRGTVCVTSAISAVDSDGRVVTTSSGRRYELMGPPEARDLERDVLRCGAVSLGMGEAVDVSVFAWDLLHFDSIELRLR